MTATRIAIVGSRGLLGSALATEAVERGWYVVHLNRPTVDVTDRDGIVRAVREVAPDHLVSTAAFHRVDECERSPEAAVRVNVEGAANVAVAAREVGCSLVWVSSDYVFGGVAPARAGQPFGADEPPCPLNLYGHTKAAGECMALYLCPWALVVRTAWLFGEPSRAKGPTFPDRIVGSVGAGRAVDVVDDQWGSPTYATDAARMILDALARERHGVLHAVNAGPPTTWHGLAVAAVEVAELDPSLVRRKATDATPATGTAARPRWSALACSAATPPRSWREALSVHLSARRSP